MEVTDDHLYRIGTAEGRLDRLLARSMFSIAQKKFLSVEDVPDNELPIRSEATKASLTGGQGFLRCNCKLGCKKSSKCKCIGAGVLCNSRCHGSLSCSNKGTSAASARPKKKQQKNKMFNFKK